MREQSVRLFEGLGWIDDELISEAESQAAVRRRLPARWLIAAACLCLLLAGAALAAVTGGFGTRLTGMFTSRTEPGSDLTESGYDLSVDIHRVSLSELTGEVTGVGEKIRTQYEDWDLLSSQFPGHWQRRFDSVEQAADFIGFEGLRCPAWPESTLESAEVDVLGSPEGALLQVTLETFRRAGEIRAQEFTTLFTEHTGQEELTTGVRTTEAQGYAQSFYTTEDGGVCQVIASTPLESGYAGLDGYLVQDGVLYHLHLSFRQEEAGRAEDLLHQWAEQLA